MSMKTYPMIIDGRAVEGHGVVDVINPATGQPFARVADCSREQLDDAVAAARRAQPAWAALPYEERRRLVVGLGDILAQNADWLKVLLTQEQGKSLANAAGEIAGTVMRFKAAADFDLPVTVLDDSAERRSETHHVPLGVVGGILAWNMPVMIFAFKLIPALLTGNTLVAKPSPYTPVTTLALAELFAKALPPGVVNVVSGGDDLGRWITEHPGVDKISFTGSSATGKKIVRSAADTMKRVSLELGGNDAAIVLPDADIKAIAEKLFWGAFRNTGQICVAVKRVYVHEDAFDALRDALLDVGKTIRFGDGMAEGTTLGPLQNKMQYERVKELLADSRAHNYPMKSVGDVPQGGGYFLPITLVENPPEDARIVAEEQFGPVLPLMKFKDVKDAIDRANASPYGLTGSVWSADTARAEEIASQLQAGTVWINTVHDSPINSPTAGHKQSGLGAENGLPGLLEYTNLQTITKRRAAAV